MARFQAVDNTGAFNGLNELATVTTDSSGRFTFTCSESYTVPPNVQCQPLTSATGTLQAANALTVTIQPPVQNAQGAWVVNGIVTGVNGVTVGALNLITIVALQNAIQVQLMILGR